MTFIMKDTADAIAYAWRDLEMAEKLLADVTDALARGRDPDIRDAFGRRQNGLQLGVPIHGSSGQRLYDVPWNLAKPILEMYIANRRSMIRTLSMKAMQECDLLPKEPPPAPAPEIVHP